MKIRNVESDIYAKKYPITKCKLESKNKLLERISNDKKCLNGYNQKILYESSQNNDKNKTNNLKNEIQKNNPSIYVKKNPKNSNNLKKEQIINQKQKYNSINKPYLEEEKIENNNPNSKLSGWHIQNKNLERHKTSENNNSNKVNKNIKPKNLKDKEKDNNEEEGKKKNSKKKRKKIDKKRSELNPEKKIVKIKRDLSADYIIKEKKNKNVNLEEFLPNKTIHKISTPGIIGLVNIGATCYMNATLQCFSNITRLRVNLLNKKLYNELEKNKNTNKKLSFAFAEVLKNLWEKLEQRTYSPEYFKQVISEMNPLFKGIAANDSKDLILFLLETMHKELNIAKNSDDIKENENVNNTIFDEVFNNFKKFYINKNKSIISEEFYGYTNNMTICQNCSIAIHNVQTNNILFFPLEEVRKFKNYSHNNVNILDCFEYYEKMDIYPSFYCNKCNQNYKAYSQTKLVLTPKTLIINLNRGKGIEFNINIIFEEYLNLRKYVYCGDSPYYYELTGVICHFGSNDMGGHFIAYCKNSNNCEWYKYNDQFVTKCSFKEVKGCNLPYVLFYSYVNS